MQPTDDSVLLRQYSEDHSDEAFAALVARHINLVYSVALRCVDDPHLAEEVAQAVFIVLAKKAAQLRHDKALSSWLFQTTRLTANNFVRGETRRHRREQEAHMQSVLNDQGTDVWPRIAPLLEDAVAGLNEKDRHAIVLRFYEGRNLREVGAALGASEDAAEKRVNRAVERLREFFTKRGVTVGASGLVVVISTNAVQAAPVGLAATISTAAAGTAALLTSTTLVTMKLLNTKVVVAAMIAAFFVGGGAYFVWEQRDGNSVAGRTLTTNEILYQELLAVAPIAGELVESNPTNIFWRERKDTLFQAGYIEEKNIPLRKVLSGKGTDWRFFTNFHARFRGVEMGVHGLKRETPPIARVIARKTDFGPTGAIEQYIRNYDPEKQ